MKEQLAIIKNARSGQYEPKASYNRVLINPSPQNTISGKLAVIIAVLVGALLVLTIQVQKLDAQLSNTQDNVMNTYTVKHYRWKSEYIQNGTVQFTAYDPTHYSVQCVLFVDSQNGHTCITQDDIVRYAPSFFADSDTILRTQ